MVALPTNAPYHGKLSVTLICDPNVSDGAKTLYSYIWAASFASDVPPTRDEMATSLHITPATVTNRLRELVKQHWIAVWDGIANGRIANMYAIFQSQAECEQFITDNPSLPYIPFKGLDKVERKSRVGKGGKPRIRVTQVYDKPEFMINPSLPREGNLDLPDRETQVDHGSAHSLLSNTENTNTERIYSEGDRASANTSPLEARVDHVADNGEMVGDPPEPFTSWKEVERYNQTTTEIDKQQREYWKDKEVGVIFPELPEKTPNPVPASPSPVDAMIAALATACMKFVKLVAHYNALKETADHLMTLGFTADDVTLWRAKCWPEHWKAKKDQPIPTLRDVLDDIGKVRMLPATDAVTKHRYLNDPYFAGRGDDDRPDPFVDDELPPRQLDPLDHGTARHWQQAVTQISGRLSSSEGKAFEHDVSAIGMAGKNTIVIEFATDEKRKKFVKSFMAFLESEFNRFDGRSDDNVKPPISFALVVVGDEQYRDEQ